MENQEPDVIFSPVYTDLIAQHISALAGFVATAADCKDAGLKRACTALVDAYTATFIVAHTKSATVTAIPGGRAKEPRPL